MRLFLVLVDSNQPELDQDLVIWAHDGEQALDLYEEHCRKVWGVNTDDVPYVALWAYEIDTTPPSEPTSLCWAKWPTAAERGTSDDEYVAAFPEVLDKPGVVFRRGKLGIKKPRKG